ncbi:MAG: GntR family transcriptional regulator [Pseudomonadota bacterium]|nr:GntR family transcriptional regulator [Pseudomonadota bacterium]
MPRGPRLNLDRSQISRYIQLSALFRTRIQTGEWPAGSQIPTVDELAEECGVARATIRQALSLLSQERLIERYRAKGTFVTGKRQDEIWCKITTDWSGLLRPSTDDARIEVLSKEAKPMALPISHNIGTPAPSYHRVRRRHWRGNRPYLLTNLYIDSSLRKLISSKDFASKTALAIIADVMPTKIGDAQHTMTIGTADFVTADALSLPVNAPIAYVRREVVDKKGILVMVSDGIYRGDVVRIDVKLRLPESGAPSSKN